MSDETPRCGRCPYQQKDRLCRNEEGKAPSFCPTKNKENIREQSLKEYKKPDIAEFAKQAAIQEGSGYGFKEKGYERVRPIKSRIEEIIEFSRRLNYQRLGLIFCGGLSKEAKVVESILTNRGFEVVSVICKVGRTPKETIGIAENEKIAPGAFESMCNPIMQAQIVNAEKTDFNVVMGLCVGHDSLVFKYAEAPCTVLVAKDRLFGHNPVAAIYTIDSYYRSLK